MILTKQAIIAEIEKGRLNIEPLHDHLYNPNSYNVRLAPELLVYKVDGSNVFTRALRKVLPASLCNFLKIPPSMLDMRKENLYDEVNIPESGIVLLPGTLYLGRTLETTSSPYHVPLYEGRSSTGRAGLESHVCAGWGDVGFSGTWTLEIRVAYPTKVYPGMEIGQVGFMEVKGDIEPYGSEGFRSRYQNQRLPVAYRGHLKLGLEDE